MQLKVASAQMVLNFAAFLEENKYFEDAFRVYEKAGNGDASDFDADGGGVGGSFGRWRMEMV